MKDREFLIQLHERLEIVHGEDPLLDYMHKLRAIIFNTPANQESQGSRWSNLKELLKELDGSFKVQFSHDKARWFDYGADAITPGKVFENQDDAKQVFEQLKSWGAGLFQYVRVINGVGEAIEQC